MFLLYEASFSDLGTPSFKLQINFGGLQIETENSATGLLITLKLMFKMLWKFASGNLRGELYNFVEKLRGFTFEKLKLGRGSPYRQTLKKNFKATNWSRQ